MSKPGRRKAEQNARLAAKLKAAPERYDAMAAMRTRRAIEHRRDRNTRVIWIVILAALVAVFFAVGPAKVWWGFRKAQCEVFSNRIDCLSIDQEQP